MSDVPARSDQATAAADQLVQLAKAALPLAPGLRAAAEEISSGRTARRLRELAEQLEAGIPLDIALQAHDKTFPAHLRRLVLSGVQSGRLPEVLEQFVGVYRQRVELRRQLGMTLAYPLVLLAFLALLFGFQGIFVVPALVRVLVDFEVELPLLTRLLVLLVGPGRWWILGLAVTLAGVLALVVLLPRPLWVRRVFYALPLVGPLWRYAGLAEFARLMESLLRQEVPLPEALRLTADGVRASDLSDACRRVAFEVESGQPLAESLSHYWQFPAVLAPFVRWAQETKNLPEAFCAAAETCEARVQSQLSLVETVIPPIMFLTVITSVLFIIRASFLPLLSLIEKLT